MEEDDGVAGPDEVFGGSGASGSSAEVLDLPDGVSLEGHGGSSAGDEDHLGRGDALELGLALHLRVVLDEILHCLLNRVIHCSSCFASRSIM